jgi:hypothetical protein
MGRRSQRWSGSASAGLIAVQVVGESSISAASPTMEIECPGGAMIRLREDVSAEVLQRVMQACQQVQMSGAGVSGSVRSC